MCAARETDFLLVASMHFWTYSLTFGSKQASSEVLRSTPNSFLKKFFASLVKFWLGYAVFGSTSTLNVIIQAINLYISPIIIIFEHGGHKTLKLSSTGTGAIFSPPAPIISSFILPVIFKCPSFSILPLSPE